MTTMPSFNMAGLLEPLIAQWKPLAERIELIDEELDQESAGKTKVLNMTIEEVKKVAENSDTAISQIVPQFKAFLEGLDEKTRAGVVYALVKTTVDEMLPSLKDVPELQTGVMYFLQKTFRSKEINEQLAAYVEPRVEKDVTPPAPEVVDALRAERKELVVNANLIQQLIERTDEETAKGLRKFDQKRGFGTSGTSGKGSLGERLQGTFQFSVDGIGVGTSLTDVARRFKDFAVNGEKNSVKAAILSAIPDFDFKSPPDRFEFTIEGKKIIASATSSDSDTPSDDSDVMTEELPTDASMPDDPFS